MTGNLDQLLEDGVIDEVLGRLKSGKEADVWLVRHRDEVLAAGLMMGAEGGIGTFYNVVPELFVDLYKRSQSQDWAGALAVQDRINTIRLQRSV